MYVADLIVTKPGGLTVSEAIASTLPMAIFKAYPGQEEDNAVYLERNNMAVRLPKKNSGKVVHDLLLNPKKLNEMKKYIWENSTELDDMELASGMYDVNTNVDYTNERISKLRKLRKSLKSIKRI